MSILTVSNLAKSYGPQDVLEDVSFAIPHRAKIALVGPNGSGKTTLLRLIAGREEATSGVIHRAKGVRVAYLPQRTNFSTSDTLWGTMLEVFADLQAQSTTLRSLEAAMTDSANREKALQQYGPALEAFELAGGYTYEQRIGQVLSGLGFDKDDFQRSVAQLSGGQKTRAMLARLLLEEPDLLLMDEPTNYLDLAGVEWLENYLKSWKGAVLVVAHDRAFLNAVVEQVWELDWGRLERYHGNYSAYVIQKTERVALQQAKYKRQQQFIARTEEFIRRNIAGQHSREAKGRRKRLERVERIERPGRGAVTAPLLDLGDAARSGDMVLGLYGLTVGYKAAQPLFTVEDLELRRGQRVALLGANGSGKTTLLRTILGEAPPLTGRVRIGASVHLGYFAQGQAHLTPEETVIETILNAGELTAGQTRNLLGRYRFSGDDVFKRIGDLSGGEQARVALAVLALRGANVLLLDEPTNHLDIPSQEVLQEVLSGFGGTLLLVTHDRYLIRRLATRVWAIDAGQLWEFKEGYEEYHDWETERRQQKQARPGIRGQTERERLQKAHRVAEREAARQAHRQMELEQSIHRLEMHRAQLEIQLAIASEQKAVERVRQLGVEYSQVEAELDTLLAAWTDVV
ncbi:MAG: ATP-binding cassette domain-containing protein [Chloroflexota bacterium]|nr:ATP-binding cassette domain-containing protein [Chloroflexota bacterium]